VITAVFFVITGNGCFGKQITPNSSNSKYSNRHNSVACGLEQKLATMARKFVPENYQKNN
jgi:hypothetical protein